MTATDVFREFHFEMWVSIFTLIVSTVVAAIIKGVKTKVKSVYNDMEHSKRASLSMLHDRLYQGYNFYLRIGAITSDDLENMDYMFKEYVALGGNGTGEVLHGKVNNLPIVSSTRFEEMVISKGGRQGGLK